MDLLEKYYDFDSRCFYKTEGSFDREMRASMLNISLDEYNNYCRVYPYESILATKVCILSRFDQEINGQPYMDFWHHLLDYDFCEISNGSSAYLSNTSMKNIKFKDEINLIRKLIFKEVSQLPFYNGKIPDKIQCSLSW